MIETNDRPTLSDSDKAVWLTLVRIGDVPVAIVDMNDTDIKKWIDELEAKGLKTTLTAFKVGHKPTFRIDISF